MSDTEFVDEVMKLKDCNFSKILLDNKEYELSVFYYCYCDEKAVMICENCKEQCHKDHEFNPNPNFTVFFDCECKKKSHKWENKNVIKENGKCIYKEIESCTDEKYSYYYINEDNEKVYLCKICSLECSPNEEIKLLTEEKIDNETKCDCEKHKIYLECELSSCSENLLNFDYNLFKKNKKLENIYLYYISNIKIEARTFNMLMKFMEDYHGLSNRKYYIPDEFLKDYTFQNVRQILKQPVELFDDISKYVYCLFLDKIKSSFISSSFILKMESVINMNIHQRTNSIKNKWNLKNQEILKEIPDFFQEYFELLDGYFKKYYNILEYTVKNLSNAYQMIKFLVKYNILNPFQFLSMMEIYLNESLKNEELEELKKSKFICKYRFPRIYSYINKDLHVWID
jgi:hypothetical protein